MVLSKLGAKNVNHARSRAPKQYFIDIYGVDTIIELRYVDDASHLYLGNVLNGRDFGTHI